MATDQGIAIAMQILVSAGCRVPADASPSVMSEVWKVVLVDVTDDQLAQAVVMHLRSPESTWWPVPGKLIECLRPRLSTAEIEGEAERLWGRLVSEIHRHGARLVLAGPAWPEVWQAAKSKRAVELAEHALQRDGLTWMRLRDPAKARQWLGRIVPALVQAGKAEAEAAHWAAKVLDRLQALGCAPQCSAHEVVSLVEDPDRSRSLRAAMEATGGVMVICRMQDGPQMGATRAAFRRAYVAERQRRRHHRELGIASAAVKALPSTSHLALTEAM